MRQRPLPMLLCATALLATSANRSPNQHSPAPAAQRQADDRMWAVMHQMLLDFGYTNQAQALNQAWNQHLEDSAEEPDTAVSATTDSTSTAAQIAAACAQVPTLDAALRLACSQSRHPSEIIRGLLYWIFKGASPTLQGRTDLALHFLYAAAAESALGLGQAVSVAKEYYDRSQGKPFDLDDLAAGLAGAAWVQQTLQDPNWLEAWATGRNSLEKNLPSLRYGTGAASPETLAKIRSEISAAMRRTGS